jgi:hypothetical protein
MYGRIEPAGTQLFMKAFLILIGCAMTFLPFLPGWAEEPDSTDTRPPVEETYGISIVGIKLSGNGYLVDFRYRVVDPGKAAALADRKVTPYLADQASGLKSTVPTGPRMGSLRAKGTPVAGKTYFILFSNGKKVVKKGSIVDVVIGDFRAEGLTVE